MELEVRVIKHRKPVNGKQKSAKTALILIPEWLNDFVDRESDRTGYSRSTVLRDMLINEANRIDHKMQEECYDRGEVVTTHDGTVLFEGHLYEPGFIPPGYGEDRKLLKK